MALAELAVNGSYASASPTDAADRNDFEYQYKIVGKSRNRSTGFGDVDIVTMPITRHLRQPVIQAHTGTSSRPTFAGWITVAVDGVMLLSFAFVVTAFFIFLLELSAGRIAFLMPIFSTFIVFSIIGAVAIRLRRAVSSIQRGGKPH